MATHVLPADTLISTLSLASGDTIDLNGHSLIVDADAVATPVTLTNAGGIDCNLELRDLSRIKLNATLPATIHPWIDPEHPLPVAAEPGIDGDPYRTQLTANARAEIQLNGSFSLGGGAASLPTETRAGAFWAHTASWQSDSSCQLASPINCHVGDMLMRCGTTAVYAALNYGVVASFDPESLDVSFAASIGSGYSAGDALGLVAGGVVISRGSVESKNVALSASCIAGTINFVCSTYNCFTGAPLTARRVGMAANGFSYAAGQSSGLCGYGSALLADEVVGYILFWNFDNECCGITARVGELVATGMGHGFPGAFNGSEAAIGGGYLHRWSVLAPSGANGYRYGRSASHGIIARLANMELGLALPSNMGKAAIATSNCTVCGIATGDQWLETSGTVTRTARTNFPTDTDLPDAQYHAPNAADAVTWRYEDRWVRRGETLRMRARWMPAGASSRASVAVTELATWWPDLWPIGAEALAKAEFAAGLEHLTWHNGAVEWRNDTGEDCQVRVWECVNGDTLGGYLRVWDATGGAM